MTNMRFTSLDEFDDVSAHNKARELARQGMSEAEILAYLNRTGRDNSRTPMQWDASPYAGFSTHQPWLPVNPNYEMINVESQLYDSHSVLNFHREMIRLRKRETALVYGRYALLLAAHPQIYAYSRTWQGQRILVLCNLSGKHALWPEADLSLRGAISLLANMEEGEDAYRLRPWEARVYTCHN